MTKSKLNLLDEHRQAWLHLLGKTKRFRGTVSRFGHKHRQGKDIKKGATLVLTDVHLVGSPNTIDHVWIDYTPNLAILGEHLRPNGIIEFEATVDSYVKGGSNIYGKGKGTFDDLGLSNIKSVKIIKEPYWTKQYDALIGDNLISYAITTHRNVKSGGLVIGKDPKGFLGSIHVGQGFANQLARFLSYRWAVELPAKYRSQR